MVSCAADSPPAALASESLPGWWPSCIVKLPGMAPVSFAAPSWACRKLASSCIYIMVVSLSDLYVARTRLALRCAGWYLRPGCRRAARRGAAAAAAARRAAP
jgi:hypothetical protein